MDDNGELPEDLAADAMTELKAVVADLEQVLKLLGQGASV
jgi:hypothetical protein